MSQSVCVLLMGVEEVGCQAGQRSTPITTTALLRDGRSLEYRLQGAQYFEPEAGAGFKGLSMHLDGHF